MLKRDTIEITGYSLNAGEVVKDLLEEGLRDIGLNMIDVVVTSEVNNQRIKIPFNDQEKIMQIFKWINCKDIAICPVEAAGKLFSGLEILGHKPDDPEKPDIAVLQGNWRKKLQEPVWAEDFKNDIFNAAGNYPGKIISTDPAVIKMFQSAP